MLRSEGLFPLAGLLVERIFIQAVYKLFDYYQQWIGACVLNQPVSKQVRYIYVDELL